VGGVGGRKARERDLSLSEQYWGRLRELGRRIVLKKLFVWAIIRIWYRKL